MSFFHQPSRDLNPILALGLVTAGTGDIQTFTETAMSPQWAGVWFLGLLGTITSSGVATLTAKGSVTSGTYGSGTVGSFFHTDSSTIVEGQATTGDSNTVIFIDLYRPGATGAPFIRGQIQRATANIVINAAVAVQYASETGGITPTNVATHATNTNTDGPGYSVSSNAYISTT
jgi:hypothetical protein